MSSSPGTNGKSFEAILFDVGGVMLTNGWDHNERKAVLEQFSLDRAEFEARHEAPYDAWERDTIAPSDYLQATVFYQPRPFTEEQFLDAMKAVSLPIPSNAIPLLQEISGKSKWLVGTLNNETRLLHEYRMRKYGIASYLDVQLCSAYVGLRKPEPAIYRRALDILGIPGERVIFIDDRANNTAAAASVGMHAIQFQGEDKLRNNLAELGIL
jgi:putative hydrolase of the HAD superfamily